MTILRAFIDKINAFLNCHIRGGMSPEEFEQRMGEVLAGIDEQQ